MRGSKTVTLLLAALALSLPTVPARAQTAAPKGVAWVKVDGGYQANVNWCVVAGVDEKTCDFAAGLQAFKVTEKDQVTVEISNFNFLRYRPDSPVCESATTHGLYIFKDSRIDSVIKGKIDRLYGANQRVIAKILALD